jgi:predicted DNA-binding protein
MKKQVNIKIDVQTIEQAKYLGELQKRSFTNLVEFLIHKEYNSVQDEYFTNEKNLEAIQRGIQDIKEGKVHKYDPNKSIWDQV